MVQYAGKHMIITTERLHYLWAVAETGSFMAAGRRLPLAPRSHAFLQKMDALTEQAAERLIVQRLVWFGIAHNETAAAQRCRRCLYLREMG